VFFGSTALTQALARWPIIAVDIGARHGFIDDLLPIAAAVDAVGVEPDKDECERLNRTTRSRRSPWRSLRYIPVGLAREEGRRDLYISRHRGSSSMLGALPGVACRYMRKENFTVEKTVTVDTLGFDDALTRFGIGSPAYIKIDVEGMEKEVFDGGAGALGNVLAVRTEVAFTRTRSCQPLYHEIDSLLRSYGLVPFGFLELHEWRRTTRRKHPLAGHRSVPFSRGQLIHGDVVYLRDVATIEESDEAGTGRMLQLAALALCYEFVDEAASILRREVVVDALRCGRGPGLDQTLKIISGSLADRYRRRRRLALWHSFRNAVFRRG